MFNNVHHRPNYRCTIVSCDEDNLEFTCKFTDEYILVNNIGIGTGHYPHK